MEAYAKDAETDARERGFELDYSEASLEQVDRILAAVASDGVLKPQSQTEEDRLWLLSKVYGGYLGQVVIRQMGGQWELQDLPDGNARVVLRSCGILAFPPEKIYKRLTQDPFSNVGGYCRALRTIAQSNEGKR